jgi:hypothetical protein
MTGMTNKAAKEEKIKDQVRDAEGGVKNVQCIPRAEFAGQYAVAKNSQEPAQ